MNPRMLALVGALVGALLALGVWQLTRPDDGSASAATAVATPAGSLRFTIPTTWRTLRCSSDEGDCVRVLTSSMNDGDAATVSFLPPNPEVGTPIDPLINPEVTVPGSTRITVDGLPATRLDPNADGQDAIVVAGRARTEVGHAFMVICPVAGNVEQARELCDQILGTLKVTR